METHFRSTTLSFYVVVVHFLNFSLLFSVLLRAVLVRYTQPAGPRVPQAAGQRRGGPAQGRSFQVVLEAPRLAARLVSLHKPLLKEAVIRLSEAVILLSEAVILLLQRLSFYPQSASNVLGSAAPILHSAAVILPLEAVILSF